MLSRKKIVNQKLTIAILLTLAIGPTAVTASEHSEKPIHRAAENAIEEVLGGDEPPSKSVKRQQHQQV